MNLLSSGMGGLVGTVALMLFTFGTPILVGMPAIDISGFIGSLFTKRRWAARVLGASILLAAGFGLAVICSIMWHSGVGDATLMWGLIFGGASGILALLLLSVLMTRGQRPPTPSTTPDTVGAFLWLGYLVYGLVVAAII